MSFWNNSVHDPDKIMEQEMRRALKEQNEPARPGLWLGIAAGSGLALFALIGLPDLLYIMRADHQPPDTAPHVLEAMNPSVDIPDPGLRTETPDTMVAGNAELRIIGLKAQAITVHITKVPGSATREVKLPANSRQRITLPKGCHRFGWAEEGRPPQIIMKCHAVPGSPTSSTLDLANPTRK